ncbi:MAG: hypothetical protein LBG58_11500 [Planctomycetaceae bacterium]|jgi:hypothetical protein|nr:hypothetical protein [Planctomycetaceae bacterium]
MNDFTDFEKKLAEQIPQLRRNVKNEVLTAMNQPVVRLKLQTFQNTFQKTLQYHRQQIQSMRQYLVVCIGCFFLGAAFMYVMMTYFSENSNRNISENPSTQTNCETVRYETILPPLTAEFLSDVNSPMELLKKMQHQKMVRLTPQERIPTQRQLIREFQM